jgi:regulator of protease activity HflC (stomatin/prohibitin superfamily)
VETDLPEKVIDEITPDTDTADSEIDEAPVDWQNKFEGQRKVNRDLERKYREATAASAERDAAAALKDKPAEEQALEAARVQARAEATATSNARLVKVELRAAAKGKLADPADALAFINLADFHVNDDGEVDSAALDDAIDELLTRKPHLSAAPAKRFEGTADQGANRVNAPSQLTALQLQSMTPQEINAARRDGRLKSLLNQ